MGRSIAVRFAREGARVAALDVNPSAAAATVESIHDDGGDATAVAVNIAAADTVDAARAAVIEAYGRVDVLVNNAGIHDGFPTLAETTEELWDRVIRRPAPPEDPPTWSALQLLAPHAAVVLEQPQRSAGQLRRDDRGGSRRCVRSSELWICELAGSPVS
ncbi:SDR family NAD(P)-dependent oxidoreductase [Arthrobacter sp. UYCu723]